MQDLLEVLGAHPFDGLGPTQADLRVLGEGDRDPHGGLAGALADAGLEHPESVAFDRELAVEHVAVVRLEPLEDERELGVGRGERVGHGLEGKGRADARHDVLALGVDEEVAVGARRAGRGVAGERHAGAGPIVAVAEHHRLHVHRGAEVVGDPLPPPVGLGTG